MGSSKTQVDLLGDRLKRDVHTEGDLRLLDEYRRSFGDAYQAVIKAVREKGYVPTGRLAKSTGSIVEKLRRESIRLSQMQDVAGCRIVVPNSADQDRCLADLQESFVDAPVTDRREKPAHGYRGIHIIPEVAGMPVEIQVRTSLQHEWAELSEKSSDVLDPRIKYGGGPEQWLTRLMTMSRLVADYENCEKQISVALAGIANIEDHIAELPEDEVVQNETRVIGIREQLERSKRTLALGTSTLPEVWNLIAEQLKMMGLALDKHQKR